MASDLMNVGATGKYYKVQSNGKAQAGLSIGDRVVTNSGTYQILDVNADGSYKSALYDENMTTKNYTGKYANGYNPYSNATSLSDETKNNIKDLYSGGYEADKYKEKYEEINSKRPDKYESAYKEQINDILEKLENREEFSYDLNSDMLYQQYKNQYVSLGQTAMSDTMGQAAGLTGGYGNTYAYSAGAAAYNNYIQQLNNMIPELYENARESYQEEGNELYRLYSLYVNAEKSDYEKYRDDVNDWQSERDYYYKEYRDEIDRERSDYFNKLSIMQDAAKTESSDYWKNIENENEKWNQNFKEKQFEYEKYLDGLKNTSVKISKTSSKGKKATASIYDDALQAFNDGGENGLMMIADKLSGSGYDKSSIDDVLQYARRYGKKSDKKSSSGKAGFNSVLVDLFNYRG